MVEAPSCAHAQVFEAVLLSQISLSYHLTDQLCLCICLLQNTAYLCSGNTECSCGILLCFRKRWPLVCYTFSILQVPAQIGCFLGLSCTDCHAQYCPKLNILSSLSTLSLGSLLVFLYAFSHLEFPFSVHLWLFRSTLSSFFFMVFVCLFVCSLFFFCLHVSAENFNGVFSQSSTVCFGRRSCVAVCQGHHKQAEMCPWSNEI